MNENTSSDLVLQLDAAEPNTTMLTLRVSPGRGDELKACLQAQGLHVSDVIELSAGTWLDVLAVALGAQGPLKAAILAFFDRNKGKKITFGLHGQAETMEGYSGKDVDRFLRALDAQQRAMDARWADSNRELSEGDNETP